MKILKFTIDLFIGIAATLMLYYVTIIFINTFIFTPAYFKKIAVENFQDAKYISDSNDLAIFRIETDSYHHIIYVELKDDGNYNLMVYCNRESTFNKLLLNDMFNDRHFSVDIRYEDYHNTEKLEDYKIVYLMNQYILSHD